MEATLEKAIGSQQSCLIGMARDEVISGQLVAFQVPSTNYYFCIKQSIVGTR